MLPGAEFQARGHAGWCEPSELHYADADLCRSGADLDSSARLFQGHFGERELLASAVFIAASITDGIDGYLARKRRQITTLGMLLDPLADKLMVTAAFITLVEFNPRIVPAWVAVIGWLGISGERAAQHCRQRRFHHRRQ